VSLRLSLVGTLAGDAISRTTATGKVFATAQELLAQAKGDDLAVSGRGELTVYTARDGEERHGLKCVVESLLSPYQLRQKRERVGAVSGRREIDRYRDGGWG